MGGAYIHGQPHRHKEGQLCKLQRETLLNGERETCAPLTLQQWYTIKWKLMRNNCICYSLYSLRKPLVKIAAQKRHCSSNLILRRTVTNTGCADSHAHTSFKECTGSYVGRDCPYSQVGCRGWGLQSNWDYRSSMNLKTPVLNTNTKFYYLKYYFKWHCFSKWKKQELPTQINRKLKHHALPRNVSLSLKSIAGPRLSITSKS